MNMAEYQEEKIVNAEKNGKTSILIRIKNKRYAAPGQYIIAWSKGFGETVLNITRIEDKEIEMSINSKDEASKRLLRLKKKDTLYFRGPYGHGFPMNNLKNKDIVIIGQNDIFAPLVSAQNHVLENKKEYGKVKNIIFQPEEENDEFIELIEKKHADTHRIRNMGELKELLEDENKKTEYLLSLDKNSLKESLKILRELGVLKRQIHFYIQRKISCGIGVCGSCASFGVHACIEGPVFRSDAIEGMFE